MRILIIEDEYSSAEELKGCISTVRKECFFLPFAESIQESLPLISTAVPDIIFLDIDLSGSDGFDVFRKTTSALPVVFITASDRLMSRTLEESSITCLAKPFRPDRIGEIFHYVEKQQQPEMLLYRQAATNGATMHPLYKSRFLVKQGQKLIPVKTSDINHFSSEGSLAYLVTLDKKKYVIDEVLNELDTLLNPADFFRVNRKFIIAKDAIQSLDYYSKGQVAVKANLLESERIIVSRQQTPLLKIWLSQ